MAICITLCGRSEPVIIPASKGVWNFTQQAYAKNEKGKEQGWAQTSYWYKKAHFTKNLIFDLYVNDNLYQLYTVKDFKYFIDDILITF